MSTQAEREALLALHHRRYATKSFDTMQPVDPEDLKTILEVGRLSPSSFGYEPWQFFVINNATMREELKPIAGGAGNVLNGGGTLVAVFYRKDVTYNSSHVQHVVEQSSGQPFDAQAERPQMFKHFQEKMLELASPDAINHWAWRQTYIALGNMLTAAAVLDVDSVAVEGMYYQKVQAYFVKKGIIDDSKWGLAYCVGFGHRKEPIKPKARRPFEQVVHYLD